MPTTSIGDRALHFSSMRHTTQIKTRLGILTDEMSSGVANDLTAHLRGDSARLADTDRRLALIDGFGGTAQETGQLLSGMQTVLQGIESTRALLSDQLVNLHNSETPAQIGSAITAGRAAFDRITAALNTNFGNHSLFAGTATTTAPLADPAAMMASLATAVAGSANVADLQTAINTWFDSPTGGFATMGYLGDTGAALVRRIDTGTTVGLEARADDPALRSLLKAAATAALAGDSGLGFSDLQKSSLLRDAGLQLMSAAQPLTEVQARLGLAEQLVEETTVRHTAQKTAYGLLRNDMVAADPYRTAAELQQVQLQLETHYTLTARLSRLSLVEYI